MAAWIKVYCVRSVAHIDADDIRAAIADADLYTRSENFDIEEYEVEQELAQLRIEPADGAGGVKARIRYGSPDTRAVEVHIFPSGTDIQVEVEEALESLEDCGPKGVKVVQKLLGRVVEVHDVQFGWSQTTNMGIVLANTVAEYLANAGDGLIEDQNDNWWILEKGKPVLICSRKN